jgi:hypothetical protein
MVRQEGEIRRSPEERTIAFFGQSPDRIAEQLIQGAGMTIALRGTENRIRIVEVQDWPKRDVGKRYKDKGIDDMLPGDLWNPLSRAIRQSLIVAKDEDGSGACVRLLKAEYWDAAKNTFVSRLTKGEQDLAAREGDIAKYFGLEKYERSKLQFLDQSNRLYIVRGAYDITNPDAKV